MELINGVGAIIQFLPPYSPELNPIEHVFSKVKAFLKANDLTYLSTYSPTTVVAFCTITHEDCLSYIKHCGYML